MKMYFIQDEYKGYHWSWFGMEFGFPNMTVNKPVWNRLVCNEFKSGRISTLKKECNIFDCCT